MNKIIDELKTLVDFKDTTEPGDIVLIAAKEPQMLLYAHVGSILRDTSRKDEWWHIELNLLSFPPQQMTWTLRTQQMTGMEIFTMGGEERFFKAVDFKAPQKKEAKVKEKKSSGSKEKGFIKRVK